MKYAPLGQYLCQIAQERIRLAFTEIERVLGVHLPKSARTFHAWWGNTPIDGRHSQAWLNAGWITTDIDLTGEQVTFVRSMAQNGLERVAGIKPARRVRVARFDGGSLLPATLTTTSQVTLALPWKHLGCVELHVNKLRFPPAPASAGIYRLMVRSGNATSVYIGEAVNLHRRFGNYRRPGPSQQTSQRINAILVECLGRGGSVNVDIAFEEMALTVAGQPVVVDLSNKAIRRLAEQAALVAHGGIDVELLNK